MTRVIDEDQRYEKKEKKKHKNVRRLKQKVVQRINLWSIAKTINKKNVTLFSLLVSSAMEILKYFFYAEKRGPMKWFKVILRLFLESGHSLLYIKYK